LIYLAYKAGLDRRTGETAEHLISFMRDRQLQRSFTKPTEQTEKTRPFLAPGTSLFRYSDCNLKHPNVGTSGAETNHAPRRVPGTG
jgi:hypothetical protein